MAKEFSTSFTVDNYLMEVSFVKENGVCLSMVLLFLFPNR